MKKLFVFLTITCATLGACAAPAATQQPTATQPPPTAAPTDTPKPTDTPTPEPTATYTPEVPLGAFQPVHTDKELHPDLISIIHASDNGTLWLQTQSDIILLKENTWVIALSDIPGEIVGVDQSGLIWILDKDGSSISSWDGTSWSTYSEDLGWDSHIRLKEKKMYCLIYLSNI